MTFPNEHQELWERSGGMLRLLVISTAVLLFCPALATAQIEDETGIKRAFLDRYLDCAESANDALRLLCYDALLADIPEWLDEPTDPRARMMPHSTGHSARAPHDRCNNRPSD